MIDLCDKVDETLTHVSFDKKTAEYSFWTLDETSYPSGEYNFEISVVYDNKIYSLASINIMINVEDEYDNSNSHIGRMLQDFSNCEE